MSAPTEPTADGAAADYEPAGWPRVLWVIWSGPHWWATHLALSYLVVPDTCRLDIQWTLHLITVVCLAGTIVGGWMSLRMVRRSVPLRSTNRYALRDGYVGWNGLALNAFFGLVVVAENIPRWFLDACW